MEYEKIIIETSKSIYRYFLKIGLTSADLQKLNGQNYVKAAVLGATVENK
ncbi:MULTISPECIES: hypothetical protein [Bacillus]|nr:MULTISPECIES: hypothetical protein [Bacillus]